MRGASKLRYSSKCSAQNYRAYYGAAVLEDFLRRPTWRPENDVNKSSGTYFGYLVD